MGRDPTDLVLDWTVLKRESRLYLWKLHIEPLLQFMCSKTGSLTYMSHHKCSNCIFKTKNQFIFYFCCRTVYCVFFKN